MNLNYPTADPAWGYFYVWESVEDAAAILAATRALLDTAGDPSEKINKIVHSNITDAIVHLNSIIEAIAPNESPENDFQPITPYLKIGDRLLNPTRITAIDFLSIDDNDCPCTEVGFGDSSCYFYNEEAEILKRFFLSGSKAYDLNNLFG